MQVPVSDFNVDEQVLHLSFEFNPSLNIIRGLSADGVPNGRGITDLFHGAGDGLCYAIES